MPRTKATAARRELSAEAVQLFLELKCALQDGLHSAAGDLGLSVPEARAVIHLDDPAPMRQLAADLTCDPSHVTGIVDGLERRGLITRQPDPGDRRVKHLVFTDEGRRLREALHRRVYDDAPALSRLTDDELGQFCALLAKALRE